MYVLTYIRGSGIFPDKWEFKFSMRDDYLPDFGLRMKKEGIAGSLVVGGGYSYDGDRLGSLAELRDIDGVIVLKGVCDYEALMADGQRVLNEGLRVVCSEYVFSKEEYSVVSEGRVDGLRFSGLNDLGQKVSVKIFLKKTWEALVLRSEPSVIQILSKKNRMFYRKKLFDGRVVMVGITNKTDNSGLCLLTDADIFEIDAGFSLGVVTDLLLSGRLVYDPEDIDFFDCLQKLAIKVFSYYNRRSCTREDDWWKIFYRSDRFSLGFIKDGLIRYHENIFDERKRQLTGFWSIGGGVRGKKFYVKNRTVKSLDSNSFCFERMETSGMFAANSEYGRAMKGDGISLYYKKLSDGNRFLAELNGQVQLSKYYDKIQRPVGCDRKNLVLFYDWSDYDLLSKKWINISTLGDESDQLLELELQKNMNLLNGYLASRRGSLGRRTKSSLGNIYLERLNSRFLSFYGNKSVSVGAKQIPLTDLFGLGLKINGVVYPSVEEIVSRSKAVFMDKGLTEGSLVYGLGDSHGGNVMVNSDLSDYFFIDYEFSGYHSPFIDIAKPLYNDCFFDFLYAPIVKPEFDLQVKKLGDYLMVNLDYRLSDFRRMLLKLKVEKLLAPMVEKFPDPNWRLLLGSALFCCGFLTKDLSSYDDRYFWLNLTNSVQSSDFFNYFLINQKRGS